MRSGIRARILLLVLASILLVSLVNLVITWRGPPPRPIPWLASEVARVLDGRPVPGPHWRVLDATRETAEPVARPRERRSPEAEARLARALGRPVADVRLFTPSPLPPPAEMLPGTFVAGVRDGTGWRVARTEAEPAVSRWQLTTLAGILATALLLAAAGWWLARAISRPIVELAAQADLVAPRDLRLSVAPGAPVEVERLAAAFARLGERLALHLDNRTATLAAIAHDMGTPLHRLAFHVERLDDADRARAEADIAEMRTMLAAVLAFARDTGGGAPSVLVDLGSLVDSLADDMAATGAAVALDPGPRAVVRGDPAALRRMTANLIDNALRYAGAAEVGWAIEEGAVVLTVADRGPGVAPSEAERLFQPFVRGDPSRNRDTGGTGLGLAIVRGIAEAHGGAAELSPRAGGGLSATVRLPLAG